MKALRLPLLVSALLAALTLTGTAATFPERWNYVPADLGSDGDAARFIAILRASQQVGCTHILMPEGRFCRLADQPPAYLQRVERVKAEAKALKLTLIPAVFSLGYSGRYFHTNANLAAGLPVKNMPYVVKGMTASPDPALAIDLSDPKKAESPVTKRFKAKPFHQYRLSFTMSGTNAPSGDREEWCKVLSARRSHARTVPLLKPDKDRTFVQTTFNSLEAEEFKLVIDVGKRSIENLRIEPAGLLLVVRRPLVPLTVTSQNGKTAYVEGQDFRPVYDPVVNRRPFPGEFTIDHAAATIDLTPGSRIKDGQKLLVSFWHAQRIGSDQDIVSMEDPATLRIMEQEMANAAKVWNAPGYFMNYDEIRVAGWEPPPDGLPLKPGQRLARHVAKACEIVRRHSPAATIYTWSDMFTPFHNARPFDDKKGFYYLVNGNWDGSWEGLPKDVVIMNWHSPDEKNVKFFADRGHRQVLCGYYDAGDTDAMRENVARWMLVSKDVKGIQGMMFTTWRWNYSELGEYFKLVNAYPREK
jgi:hypothetical protein